MLLGEVLNNINKKYRKIKFNNIKFNSKECKQNDIFFAIKGNNLDGKKYISNAIKNGAKIIVAASSRPSWNRLWTNVDPECSQNGSKTSFWILFCILLKTV